MVARQVLVLQVEVRIFIGQQMESIRWSLSKYPTMNPQEW